MATGDVTIEVFDALGVLVERSVTTQAELQQAHDEHRCGAFCGICYHEATKDLADIPAYPL